MLKKSQPSSALREARHKGIPVRHLLSISVAIGIVEIIIMFALEQTDGLSPWVESLIDAAAIATVSPLVIYLGIIRPKRLESSRQAELLTELMSEGMVVHDLDGSIENINSSALSILGLSAEELTARASLDPKLRAIREDGTPLPRDRYPAMLAIQTGLPQRNSIMGIERTDGTKAWIQISSIPLFSQRSHKIKGALTTFQDITELYVGRERLQLAMRVLHFGIWDWDYSRNILTWDAEMYEVFGIKRSDFSGDYDAFEKTLHPEDAPKVQKALQDAFEKHGNFSYKFRIVRNTGEIRLIAAEAKVFYSSDGKPVRLIGANWDITDARAAEARAQENRRLVSLGEMAAGVAHEINNPLAVISAYLEHIVKRIEKETALAGRNEIQSLFEPVTRNVQKISAIVSGLQRFSRDSTQDPLTPSSFQAILQDALSLCAERIKTRGIALELSITPDPIIIRARPGQIAQIIVNLLNNARDAVTASDLKRIQVSLQKTDDQQCELVVSDSGPGISPEIENKIFEPFFTTKPVNSGTGLGLSISLGIAKEHSGTLELNRLIGPSTFVLRIPLSNENRER